MTSPQASPPKYPSFKTHTHLLWATLNIILPKPILSIFFRFSGHWWWLKVVHRPGTKEKEVEVKISVLCCGKEQNRSQSVGYYQAVGSHEPFCLGQVHHVQVPSHILHTTAPSTLNNCNVCELQVVRRWAYEQARDGECNDWPTAAIFAGQPAVKVATAGTKATFQDQD